MTAFTRMARWFCATAATIAMRTAAETYMAPFDTAAWQMQGSALACHLSQVVPRFGEAIFETVGGGRQSFVLRAKKNPLLAGPSTLIAAAPSWNPNRESVALGAIEIAEGSEPLRLNDAVAAQLLDTLRDGLVPQFKRPLRAAADEQASLQLSPINFLPAYRQYRACISQLLPVTFEQIQTTVVEFASDQTELNPQAQKKIDLLLRYIKEDRAVTHFDIHAISSDKARLLDNIALSKQRAQQVSEYLMSRGIDAKFINATYRAERAGKSTRRIVSIQIKRGDN